MYVCMYARTCMYTHIRIGVCKNVCEFVEGSYVIAVTKTREVNAPAAAVLIS